jgi:hypothetical protein
METHATAAANVMEVVVLAIVSDVRWRQRAALFAAR